MSAISLFEEKQVRRVWNPIEEKWYFSIDDVVAALTDSANVKNYIKKLRKRDPELDSYWGTNCLPVEMIAADGRKRKIKAANTKSLFRIIQSIPSPKAEPFKRWLAKVGYERLEEIENPELAAKQTRGICEQKRYFLACVSCSKSAAENGRSIRRSASNPSKTIRLAPANSAALPTDKTPRRYKESASSLFTSIVRSTALIALEAKTGSGISKVSCMGRESLPAVCSGKFQCDRAPADRGAEIWVYLPYDPSIIQLQWNPTTPTAGPPSGNYDSSSALPESKKRLTRKKSNC